MPRLTLRFLMIVLGFCWTLTAVAASSDQALQVSETPGGYTLIVPVSRLAMTIPRGSLAQESEAAGGATANPRYFQFVDNANGLVISGWFEPESAFPGAKASWENDVAAWEKNNAPAPMDVSFKSVGDWEAILYDISLPGATNTHIRAHYVKAGTWIDIHCSVTSERSSKDSRELLEALLRTISVAELPGS